MKPNDGEGPKRGESAHLKNHEAGGGGGKFDALRAMLVRPAVDLQPKEKVLIKSEGDPELLQFFPGGTVMLADELQPMGSQTQLTTASTLMSNNPYRVNPAAPGDGLSTPNRHKSRGSNFSSKVPKSKTPEMSFIKSVTSFQTFEKTNPKTPEVKVETKGSGERLKMDRSVNSLQALVQLDLPKGSLDTLKTKNRHPSPKRSKNSPDKRTSSLKVIAQFEKRQSSKTKTSPHRQQSSSKTRVQLKTKKPKRTNQKAKRKVTHH